MRRTPHSIKKDPKYFDKRGELKPGYTYHPVNEGYKKVGSIKTQKRTGGGKDGTNWQITGSKTIYKDGPSSKAAPAPAPQPKPKPEAKKPEPKKPEPVKHSPEIQQAKERVQKYQEDVSSGEVSNKIYGKSNTGFLDKYQMNLNQ
jgi:hypothetical protein